MSTSTGGSEPDRQGGGDRRVLRRALVSVYDKTGLPELARALHAAGVALVSTGSTAAVIAEAGVAVTAVEELTGFGECLDGRVKTLHPAVHAGILADVRKPAHLSTLHELGIDAFDLVVGNLYPFAATVASGAGPEECVEQIDIGGPSMIRGAAKNHACVAVVVDPARYPDAMAAASAGGFTLAERRALAAQAFAHTAHYDIAVSSWFASVHAAEPDQPFPAYLAAGWRRVSSLRYGENPHQPAALYRNPDLAPGTSAAGLAGCEQLGGKEMSYNNYVDIEAARRAAADHDEPAVAVVKHANPCGVAVGSDVAEAHRKAHACDPVSAFGGVVATNRAVSVDMATALTEIFTEVVCAPDFDDAALKLLSERKNLRLLRCPLPAGPGVEFRGVSGGLLVQRLDTLDAPGDVVAEWSLVSGPAADEATLRDLAFAWRAVRGVRSNAILLADDGATVGVGMGQVNRVDAARLAVDRAGERAHGAVAASDAFFPFPDGLQVLVDAGVRAVVQPGGSVRDAESITVASDAGVTMYLTGTRHFAH